MRLVCETRREVGREVVWGCSVAKGGKQDWKWEAKMSEVARTRSRQERSESGCSCLFKEQSTARLRVDLLGEIEPIRLEGCRVREGGCGSGQVWRSVHSGISLELLQCRPAKHQKSYDVDCGRNGWNSMNQ